MFHVSVHVFTGLLSRSACGVEHPLKLSCTQRNANAWYLSLGKRRGEDEDKSRGSSTEESSGGGGDRRAEQIYFLRGGREEGGKKEKSSI